eukprot:SAG31_NODE_848_length_11534_cov_8.897463_10_plen_51_part_00
MLYRRYLLEYLLEHRYRQYRVHSRLEYQYLQYLRFWYHLLLLHHSVALHA